MESQLAKLPSKYRVNLEDTWRVYVPPSNHLVHWSESLHMRRRAHTEIYCQQHIHLDVYMECNKQVGSCVCHACVLFKVFRYINMIAVSLLYTTGRMNNDENTGPCRQENHHFGGACGHAFSIGAWGASAVELPVLPASTENNQSFQEIVMAALREAATKLNVWRKESFEDLWGCLGFVSLCDSFHIRCERNDVTWPIGVRSSDHCGLHWKEWCIPIDRFCHHITVWLG